LRWSSGRSSGRCFQSVPIFGYAGAIEPCDQRLS